MGSFANIGADVEALESFCYQSQHVRIVAPTPELIVAPSSSSLKLLTEGDVGFDLRDLTVISIGKQTSQMARKLGFDKVFECADDQPATLVAHVMGQLLAHACVSNKKGESLVQ